MSTRCPSSTYRGIARLPHYRWIINDRGYANVVAVPTSPSPSPFPSSPSSASSRISPSNSKYSTSVYGLVFSLTPTDESRLDKNEGVPHAYTKELLTVDFWSGSTSYKIDTSKRPDEKREMLVYIDRKRISPAEPRKEYVYRMNQGIADAVKLGVPEGYVREIMRGFIPQEEEEGMAEMARGQAREFRDESGVF
jgi:gamma-glutamylcyclotransferase